MMRPVLSAEMRTMPTPITEEERKEFSEGLSHITIEVEELEAEKAAENKRRSEQIKGRRQEALTLAGYVDTGMIDRAVRCEWHAIDGTAVLVRTDTGEELESRPMTLFEQERAPSVTINVVHLAQEGNSNG